MADDTKLKQLVEGFGVALDGDEQSLTPARLDALRSRLDLSVDDLSDAALERLLRGSAIMASEDVATAEEMEHLAEERGVTKAFAVDNSDLDALLKKVGGGI